MGDPSRRITSVGGLDSSDRGFGYPEMNLNSSIQLPFPQARTAPGAPGLTLPGINIASVAYRPNAVIGLNSFSTIPAHYNTLVDNSEDSQSAVDSRELSLGQLLFARNHRKAVRNKGKTGPMYAQTVGPNNCEFKELLQLNSHLKKMGGNYKTASDVLAEWKYIGILKKSAVDASTPQTLEVATKQTQVDNGTK